jgi:hypothetical protein
MQGIICLSVTLNAVIKHGFELLFGMLIFTYNQCHEASYMPTSSAYSVAVLLSYNTSNRVNCLNSMHIVSDLVPLKQFLIRSNSSQD